MKNSQNVEMITKAQLLEEKELMEKQLKKNEGSKYPLGRAWWLRWYDLLDKIDELLKTGTDLE